MRYKGKGLLRPIYLSGAMILLIYSTAAFSTPVAASSDYTKTISFDAENETDNIPEFENMIIKDGVEYTLSDIKIDTLEKIPVTSTHYYTREEEVFVPEGEQYSPPEQITMDGKKYSLESVETVEGQGPDTYHQEVSGFTDYDHFVSKEDIPQTKTITAKSAATGEDVEVSCQLVDVTENGGGWQENTISIIFYNVDADVYEWNGITVPGGQDVPLQGYEDALLESVGAGSDSRVIRTYWTSDPYMDDQGRLCRNASADVQQYVTYYRATYKGTVTTGETGLVYKCTYTGAEEQETGEFLYKREATAIYEEVEHKDVAPYVFIGIGIVILIAVLLCVSILYVLAKKRRKGKET